MPFARFPFAGRVTARRLRARVGTVLALGLAAAVSVLGSGCSRTPADTTTVSFWAIGREGEVISTLLPEFEKAHPGIRVDMQQIPLTAAHEKLLTAFAADTLPDLCQLGNTWIAEFAALDALTPLEPYVQGSEVVKQDDYFPGIWETNVIDGQLVGIPWYVDTRLLFYRKDILRQAGVKLPIDTWEQWNTAMAQVKAYVGPDRYAILMPLNEFEQQLSLGLQQDDPLLRDHNNRGNFQSPGFRKALAFYANIFARQWAPLASETQVSNVWDEFFNGYFAFYFSGPWNIREFRNRAPENLKDQWGTMPLPGPHGPGAGIAGGSSLVLFQGSRHKDAAWKLVEFLSRPDIQQRFHAMIGDLPPRRSTWRTPELESDPLARAFADQLERVKPTPKVLEWERIVQEMRLATERVVRGGQPQDAALAELDRRVDQILAKRRWMYQRDHTDAGTAGASP
ncbi:sugar ABC transporter substrate-binding protein [Pseudoxanthomonas spadix]|uniref:sugar ABC transporter substrate-binding protein n=1 Tax=Pseudoxanthomonas spadix TaxID=415229 RepID=UPI000F0079E4|nr:sugar ABC transporter substrate-binding protein [Pseudoxanthomonas spadix]MBP3973351.1 sugar ABC transporter substrate-binding protein [Pseudoxanthomonas spadix]RMW96590.1 extracellular solute-binding protein [Pseudoxanthomonas spadix]